MASRPDLWDGPLDTLGKIRRAGQVKGLHAIDLNFPQHTQGYSLGQLREALASVGLEVSAINLRYGDEFLAGGFTNSEASVRQRALDLACQGGELALQLGAKQLVVWTGQDGFDYPFQASYQQLWDRTIIAFASLCDTVPELAISIEYKPIEPRRFYVLGDMGTTLLAVLETGRENLGVTLDFAHSLLAGENPAYAAQLAASRNRLFGVHLNDAYGRADDGLLVGSIHPLQTLELLYILRQHQYPGHIYFDTFPIREDPVADAEKNVQRLAVLWDILDRIDLEKLAWSQNRQDALAALEAVGSLGRVGVLL
jgi:xylose isomerase